MGYRSNVYLKTTTEGWLILKRYNDTITEFNEQPLAYSEVSISSEGNYKIEWIDVKWYDSYKSVQHVNNILNEFDEQDVPYSFIRIGEDTTDVEHRRNYTYDDISEIAGFEPVIDINDEETYDTVFTVTPKSEHPVADAPDTKED